MRIPIDFHNEKEVLAAYRYFTRISIGRKFGSLPIGWYQSHQVNCETVLLGWLGGPGEIKWNMREDVIYGRLNGDKKWRPLGSCASAFNAADKLTRG